MESKLNWNTLTIRHTYNVDEAPQQVSYFKKRGVQLGIDGPPPSLYEYYPIPIKKAKADDLKKLVADYIPGDYQSFYFELPTMDSDNDD